MKKIVFTIILASLFLCCSTQRILKGKDYSTGIVYVLPGEVQMLIKKQDINKPNVYFCLEKIEEFKFRIYLDNYEISDNWVDSSNRYVSLSGKLYPLTFDFDEYFANQENVAEFLKNYKSGIYQRTQRSIVRDRVYHIDFTLKGEVLYEGY